MKSFKKMISIVLTAIILVSCCSILFTAVALEGEHLPQIYVSGIGSKAVYYKDDPQKNSLFYPIDTDRLLANAKRFNEYTSESIQNLDPDIFRNYVYSFLWDTFGMTALQPDGLSETDENVTVDPMSLSYSSRGVYDFNYDSRLGPVDLAKQLDDYIKLVQEHSGSQRFELVGSSYGASVVMAYIHEYPDKLENIDSVLLCVPSFGGVSVAGELFSRRFSVDHNTLTEYASIALGNEDLDLLLSVLNKSGFLENFLEKLLLPALEFAAMDALTDIIHDVIGTFPSMWSFVQEEYFYDALVNIYGKDYTDPNHEYAELIAKITYYQEQIMQKPEEIFDLAADNGVKMNIICKYGRPPVPLSEKGSFMSDGAVDVKDGSMGAVCSMYGETLPKNYQQALYPEYNFISVDRCIDASTGIAPFNTWYIKGLEHSEKTNAYYKMIDDIIYKDLDIFSDPAYPQFLEATADGKLISLTVPEPVKETSLLSDFLRLILRSLKMMLEKLTELLLK